MNISSLGNEIRPCFHHAVNVPSALGLTARLNRFTLSVPNRRYFRELS